MSVNKVIIVGRLGQDPQLRDAGGTSVCNLSVATSYRYKDKEETTWFRVTTWGNLADNCNKYLSKGRQVYVEGRIRTNTYEDKNGVERRGWELVAQNVVFLGGKEDQKPTIPEQQVIENPDDEVPF